jgi:hypothetical protein
MTGLSFVQNDCMQRTRPPNILFHTARPISTDTVLLKSNRHLANGHTSQSAPVVLTCVCTGTSMDTVCQHVTGPIRDFKQLEAVDCCCAAVVVLFANCSTGFLLCHVKRTQFRSCVGRAKRPAAQQSAVTVIFGRWVLMIFPPPSLCCCRAAA